jgi:hypothetical protein
MPDVPDAGIENVPEQEGLQSKILFNSFSLILILDNVAIIYVAEIETDDDKEHESPNDLSKQII